MPSVYCTVEEFAAWAPGFTVDPGELATVLEHASRDVDAEYSLLVVPQPDGSLFGDRVVNPLGLADWQWVKISRAAAAQAFYRLTHGEEWALGGGDLVESASGPDFTVVGRRSRFSPQARQELKGLGFGVRSARMVG